MGSEDRDSYKDKADLVKNINNVKSFIKKKRRRHETTGINHKGHRENNFRFVFKAL